MITSAPFVVGCCKMQLMPLVIDGRDFARRHIRFEGRVAIGDLSRVADFLAAKDGELECLLYGACAEDDQKQPELHLSVSGELQLICQRCLEAVPFLLNIDKRLRLISPGATWPDDDVENEEFDVIEASNELAVGLLIEDEVLLALPISPRHDVCGTPRMKESQHADSPLQCCAI